jgi:hypothetical protein
MIWETHDGTGRAGTAASPPGTATSSRYFKTYLDGRDPNTAGAAASRVVSPTGAGRGPPEL